MNPHDRDLLVDDQHQVVAKYLPWLYFLMIADQVLFGPQLLALFENRLILIGFICLTVFCIVRAIYWLFYREKFKTYTVERKKRDLLSVTVMSVVLPAFFSVLAARGYWLTGDLHNILVCFSVLVLSIAAAFGLYVLPVASISIVLAANLPILSAVAMRGDSFSISLTIVGLATVVFALYLLIQHYRTFAELVLSKATLVEEKITTKKVTDSVERLAFFDALTDLPNRRRFVAILADLQDATNKGAPGFAVGVIDIAGFKAIDDAYGRDSGDVLLRQVAGRLKELTEGVGETSGIVARLGGDEFVLVVPNIESVVQAEKFGKLLFETLKEGYDLPDTSVHLSFSCGFALFPFSDGNPDKLIARADLARKEVVGLDRDVVGVFSLELESATLRETEIKQALRDALANEELVPWFQPIVRIDDGEIVGFESLARWHDKNLGHVSPTEFIEIAEQSQMIEKLTLDLFRKSLAVARCWSADTKLYYNLSAKLFGRQESIEKMLMILEQSDFPPWRLEIELTETAVVEDLDLAKLQMQKFKDAGVGIALDDFGSGYSSLGQIRDLPLDKVKIDKCFTDQICTDVKIRHIVQALIQLCRQIEITCVVEGVEDLEQLGLLSDMGCELAQGYLFSKPIPAEKTSRRVLLINAA